MPDKPSSTYSKVVTLVVWFFLLFVFSDPTKGSLSPRDGAILFLAILLVLIIAIMFLIGFVVRQKRGGPPPTL